MSNLRDLRPLVDREVRFGGIIGEVQHRVSKNGKGWATFIVEDYYESQELRIFGEEYLRFKHFLYENNFVFIKMFIKEGWKDADSGRIGDPRIQFLNFQQLQDSLSNNAKRLSVKLEIDLIEDEHVKFFKDLIKNNKGDQELVFNVFGNGDGLKVNLNSTKYKVKINEQLLKSLKEKKLDFRLN